MFGVVEEIRHKNGEFFTALCGFPTYPCCARRNSLNATPPGQWHITQVPGWLPSLAVDVRVSCFYRDSCAKKAAAFFKKSISIRASRGSALIFLYSASWVAVISSPSIPEWVFLHLFTQHPHGLRDQTVGLCHFTDHAGVYQRPPDTTCCLNSSLYLAADIIQILPHMLD